MDIGAVHGRAEGFDWQNLPPGPHREFCAEIKRLYEERGAPSMRSLAAKSHKNERGYGKSTISNILHRGHVPSNWNSVVELIQKLGGVPEQLKPLWKEARAEYKSRRSAEGKWLRIDSRPSVVSAPARRQDAITVRLERSAQLQVEQAETDVQDALWHLDQERYDDAERLVKGALATYRKHIGDRMMITNGWRIWICLLVARGRLTEALTGFRSEMRRQQGVPDVIAGDLLRLGTELAAHLLAARRSADAEALLREAILSISVPRDDATLFYAQELMAQALLNLGPEFWPDALSQLDGLLHYYMDLPLSHGYGVLKLRDHIARICDGWMDDRAEAEFREIHKAHVARFGPLDTRTIAVTAELTSVMARTQEGLIEAQQIYGELVELAKLNLPEGSPQLFVLRHHQSRILVKAGRLPDAEKQLRELLDICLGAEGRLSENIVSVWTDLINLLENSKRHADADDELKRLIPMMEKFAWSKKEQLDLLNKQRVRVRQSLGKGDGSGRHATRRRIHLSTINGRYEGLGRESDQSAEVQHAFLKGGTVGGASLGAM